MVDSVNVFVSEIVGNFEEGSVVTSRVSCCVASLAIALVAASGSATAGVSRVGVQSFVEGLKSGSETALRSSFDPTVKFEILHRDLARKTDILEQSGKGSKDAATQVGRIVKLIGTPTAYSCGDTDEVATCRSQVARGKGSAVISVRTSGAKVSYVRVSYATFAEMYRAFGSR